MRKRDIRQLLNLAHTMAEAHSEVEDLLAADRGEAAVRLLADCRDGAVSIGRFIQQTEGAGSVVAQIEQYKVLLRQCVAEIGDRREYASGPEAARQLAALAAALQAEIKPDKVEILFLPYMASMWDSLESVWLAARDDPACDTYVVPIPYYDRLPDGSPGTPHYEGALFPDYVPVTDWRAYNIAERRPDIIFIHNPYDDSNYVTTVHPDYYSRRLKNLTDLLVYIPYFVCGDELEAHFCTSPGVLYADKVIVQSEKIREIYIRNFHKMEDENNCRGRFGEAGVKFVALGSPKFDKVRSTRREDCVLPPEWRRLISKEDGSRKRVVLYNTTISALLAGDEKVAAKLRYVFACFRQRDDLVLWWRPHPLNTATYRSMRPQLLAEYERIVTEYREQGWGIYDDSADLHRAVAMSDAYYGDGSSLVPLYQSTGKPLMMADTDITGEVSAWRNLAFSHLYDDSKYFWFTAINFNALFRMDKESWQAEYMGSFPGEKMNGWSLYEAVTAVGGNLYFAPYAAEAIGVYTPGDRIFASYTLAIPSLQTTVEYNKQSKFSACVGWGDFVFFAGITVPAVARLDTRTGLVDYFSDWVQSLEDIGGLSKDGLYFGRILPVDRHLIMPACCANAVVVFDMESCVSVVHVVGSANCRYFDVCYDGECYWLSPLHDGPVVKWNRETGEYKEFDNFPLGYNRANYAHRAIIFATGQIWLLPYQANMALRINRQTEEMEIVLEFQAECEHIWRRNDDFLPINYIAVHADEHTLYAHTGKTNRLIACNFRTGSRREEAVTPPAEIISQLHMFARDTKVCSNVDERNFYENGLFSLPDFISHVIADENAEADIRRERRELFCRDMAAGTPEPAGTLIHVAMKAEIIY
jgi:hypothetical protein